MAITLTHVGRTPGQTQFGLDTFNEHYKASEAADVVLTDGSVPQKGDAHPDYANMFVTDRHCSEDGESASALELVYVGYFSELPPVKNSEDNPVQSATSYTSSFIFPAVAAVPATIQYRSHATSIVCWSTTDTSAEVCPDPDAIVIDDIITWTLVAEQPASDFDGIAAILLSDVFVQRIREITSAEEVVEGQFWQITKRKTMNLFPYAPPT